MHPENVDPLDAINQDITGGAAVDTSSESYKAYQAQQAAAKEKYNAADYQPTGPGDGSYRHYNDYLPVVGGLVQVSFFDGIHAIRNAFGHVLSVSPASHESENDLPTITVVYPKQPAVDSRTLSGPDWAKAFERQAGVPHVTHDAVTNRTSSIAYMALFPAEDQTDILKPLFDAPEGDPTLRNQREDLPPALRDSPQMAYSVQTGSRPTPTVQSPLVNDQETIVYDAQTVDRRRLADQQAANTGQRGKDDGLVATDDVKTGPDPLQHGPIDGTHSQLGPAPATEAPGFTDVVPESKGATSIAPTEENFPAGYTEKAADGTTPTTSGNPISGIKLPVEADQHSEATPDPEPINVSKPIE